MVPLHMAMVAAAIANGGVMMEPYVVHSTTNSRGQTLSVTRPQEWLRPISPQTAATLNELMQGVVTNGTASCCLGISGIPIAAKTGTAQLNSSGEPERSHAWIIGFAGPPGETPHVAVAVIVEGQPGASEQTGGRVAAPIAAAVMQRALAAPERADQADGDSGSGG